MLALPRVAIRCGAVGAIVGVIALGMVVADYAALRRASVDSATFARRLAEEARINGRLRASLDAVHRELQAWPRLEATIGEPFDRVPPARLVPAAVEDTERALHAVRHGTATLNQAAELMTRLRDAVKPLPSRWPVRAAINSHFGPRRSPWKDDVEFHRGVDIAAAQGSEVVAPAPGSVVFSGRHGAYRLVVKVQHAAGVETLYGHLSQVSVRRGDRVERGHVIGRSGSTGRSTGAHLHYEVLVAGRAVNPKAYLWG